MGLKDPDALRALCEDLSSEAPSPGGGTASAAAGAMAASLLAMVCKITARNKRHLSDAPRLRELAGVLERGRNLLIELAEKDALSYDSVADAMRKQREAKDSESERKAQEALRTASEVPMMTSSACADVLDLAVEVSRLGTRSASSDVGVAVLLAHAGLKGAAMNVRINLQDLTDRDYAGVSEEKLRSLERRAEGSAAKALATLERPSL